MSKRILAGAILWFSATWMAMGQTPAVPLVPATAVKGVPIQVKEGVKTSVDVSKTIGTATKIAAAASKAAEAPKSPAESPRMQRIKTLKFDRRTSTILKTWSGKADQEAKTSASTMPSARPSSPARSVVIGPDGQPIMVGGEEDAGTSATAAVADPKLDEELLKLQNNVALGKWNDVKSYLATIPEEEATTAFQIMLTSLASSPSPNMGGGPVQQSGMRYMEKNQFTVTDVLGLLACAPTGPNPKLIPERGILVGATGLFARTPGGLNKTSLSSIINIVRTATTSGILPEVVRTSFKQAVEKPEAERILNARDAARILVSAGMPAYAGDFLPTPEQAREKKDLEALNLLSQHFLGLHARDKKAGYLERAWAATQGTLSFPDGPKEELEEGLRRAVDLASQIEESLGQKWLEESFSKQADRGKDILATLGTLASRGLSSRPMAPPQRLAEFKLLQVAIEALLKATPKQAEEWKPILTQLGAAWLVEAEFSRQFDRSTGSGSRMRRDIFGNFYFTNPDDEESPNPFMMMQQQDRPQPIAVGELLRAGPGTAWLERIDPSLQPKLHHILAQLHLKVAEEDKAFPHIEKLASAQPDQAKELAKEFLRVWIRNHDFNAEKNMNRNPYIFFFGFEQRADGIPLTRSKQERNLEDLSKWVARMKKLPLGEIDQELLMRAFTSSHSSAEVFKAEAIAKVFGSLDKLNPRTLASLAQTMRGNLAGLWRAPREQEKNKTNRKQKDIEIEVLRGYQVAGATIQEGLKNHPKHWGLTLAAAALMHDQIAYQQELAKNSDFSSNRAAALKIFAEAAKLYEQEVAKKTMTEDEETTQPYDQWFYASLGAVDLSEIKEEQVPDLKQPTLIRDAMLKLPTDAAKRHMDKFANALFTRMSSAKPQVKFRYLKGGFEIVDREHKQAVEARKVFDYYGDLVKELKLQVLVDGEGAVGHDQPFGVFVNLYHTRDIERESGGFSKYLVNQSNMMFAFNYGRPISNYRDRFETNARETLKEQYEVLSITFQDASVNSRAAKEFGWRYTPYAYMLLKPRGPQVDKIPQLRLDLDFLDTSGFVVLPIESPMIPIDARPVKGDPRPLSNVTITEVLDERQAKDGKLLLEIKAVGTGLMGKFEETFQRLDVPGFEVGKIDDPGVAVSKFDPEAPNAVVSERTWTISLTGKSGQKELPKQFRFPAPKIPVKEVIYQRYQDADLINVTEEVSLESQYGSKAWWQSKWFVKIVFALIAFVIGIVGLGIWLKTTKPIITKELPSQLSPFQVIELLEGRRRGGNLSDTQQAELAKTIRELEEFYYSNNPDAANSPDLRAIASRWM
jgi:hypothetical protein